jgi:hypothetical protein
MRGSERRRREPLDALGYSTMLLGGQLAKAGLHCSKRGLHLAFTVGCTGERHLELTGCEVHALLQHEMEELRVSLRVGVKFGRCSVADLGLRGTFILIGRVNRNKRTPQVPRPNALPGIRLTYLTERCLPTVWRPGLLAIPSLLFGRL